MGLESADCGQLSLHRNPTGYPLVTVASTKEEADWPLLFQGSQKKSPLPRGENRQGADWSDRLERQAKRTLETAVAAFPRRVAVLPGDQAEVRTAAVESETVRSSGAGR